MLLEAFMSQRQGINGRLPAICVHRTLGSAPPFLEEMRRRTEIEMAFMGILKVSAPRLLNILLRELPGEVLEKFQIFSDTTADYAGFRLWGAPAAYVPMNAMII
jgi:hypothetical protein